MLRKILTTGLAAGVVAGIIVSVAQMVAVNPLIAQAERLEAAASQPGGQSGGEVAWQPAAGLERTGYTVLTNVLTGTGFGLLLAGCFVVCGRSVNGRRGLLWGLGGFAAFALAPALGLPPEAPGAVAPELSLRQGWWLGAVAGTASGLALLVFAPARWLKALGVLLLVLPHAIGAPPHGGGVAPELAGNFVIASLATTALFWLVLGGLSGAVYRRLA